MEIDYDKVQEMQEYLKHNETPGIDRAFEILKSDGFFVNNNNTQDKLNLIISILDSYNVSKDDKLIILNLIRSILIGGDDMNVGGIINVICGSKQYIEEYGNTVIWEDDTPKLY